MAVKDLASLTEVRIILIFKKYQIEIYFLFIQVLDKEVVFNWNLFFEQFVNSDNKDEMVMNLSEMIVKVI